VLEREVGSLVLPCAVAAEVDYLVRREGGAAVGRRFLEDLAGGRFRLECLDQREHAMALVVHDKYADFDLGLADLSVVVLAHRFKTRRLLTFDDRHFRTIRAVTGEPFILLPADEPDA
jgi:predicted nucleic acid-binding protein